jgi:homoserine kinase type II
MFEGTHLTGLIDFYNACSGPMLYDVAIALNDWCADEAGHLDAPRARALAGCLRGIAPVYRQRSRVVADHVARGMCAFLAVTPDCSQTFAGQDVLIHDPAEFERLLAVRQNVSLQLPFAL